jgi:curved DNA-binding protein CbpA
MPQTLYEILDVPTDASAEEIDAAYRQKVKEVHPDVNDAPDARDAFTRVQVAKDVLTDDSERSSYDRLGHDAYVRERDIPVATGVGPQRTHESANGGSAAVSERRGTTAGVAQTTRNGSATETSTRSEAERDSTNASRNIDPDEWQRATASKRAHAAHSVGWSSTGADNGGSYAVRNPVETNVGTVQSRTSLTQESPIQLVAMSVLYPLLLYGTVTGTFPLPVNVVIGFCTVCLVLYMLSIPELSMFVFGLWSVTAPVAAWALLGWHPLTTYGLFILGACWVPLLVAMLIYSALRM